MCGSSKCRLPACNKMAALACLVTRKQQRQAEANRYILRHAWVCKAFTWSIWESMPTLGIRQRNVLGNRIGYGLLCRASRARFKEGWRRNKTICRLYDCTCFGCQVGVWRRPVTRFFRPVTWFSCWRRWNTRFYKVVWLRILTQHRENDSYPHVYSRILSM